MSDTMGNSTGFTLEGGESRHKKKSAPSKLAQSFKSIDEFSQGYHMKIMEDEDQLTSWMGTFATIILLAIMGIFCYSKVLAWYEFKDVDIMSSTMENFFDYEYKFDSTQGLFVAAAITEYDLNTEIIEKPEMGELVIEHYGWGYDDSTIGSN